MTVKEIMRDWLKAHGYDGLCNPGYCGCDLDDLMFWCSGSVATCEPAYKFRCNRCVGGSEGNNDCPLNEDYDYLMSVDKNYCQPTYMETVE